jgi:Secretion system C-terminal sorting domain
MRNLYFILTVLLSAVSFQAKATIIGCPTAGQDGFITISDSDLSTIDLFSLITGEQTGGTWIRVAGVGGTFDPVNGTFTAYGLSGIATTSFFIYTISGIFPCLDDTSSVNVFICQQPDAGLDGCISVSDTNPTLIDLHSLISGEQVGGVWTRTGTGVGGTFNAASGTYTPAIGATTSTFEYRITATLPCVDDSSIATVIINGPPNGSAVTLFCDGANSTANSVAFDWNNVGQTSFNFSYTINGGPAVSGNTTISNYQVLNVPTGASVTFTVQPIGADCFPSSSATCSILSNTIFESDVTSYYPNPFHDILNLKFAETVNSIQITNVLGQQVFSSDYNEKDIQINLDYLNEGSYFLRSQTAKGFKTFKIIKN